VEWGTSTVTAQYDERRNLCRIALPGSPLTLAGVADALPSGAQQ
jgi:hypothetical protein